MAENQYTEDSIRSLDWKEHIRMRPGMYIGKLGDGTAQDDGVYILLKEVVDNCVDEYVMGHGKNIEVNVRGKKVIKSFKFQKSHPIRITYYQNSHLDAIYHLHL